MQQHATALRDLFSSRPPAGSDWLRAIRERAMADFTSRGFPSPNGWKTGSTRMCASSRRPTPHSWATRPGRISQARPRLWQLLMRFTWSSSTAGFARISHRAICLAGLLAGPLGSLAREFPKLFEKHFGALLRQFSIGDGCGEYCIRRIGGRVVIAAGYRAAAARLHRALWIQFRNRQHGTADCGTRAQQQCDDR